MQKTSVAFWLHRSELGCAGISECTRQVDPKTRQRAKWALGLSIPPPSANQTSSDDKVVDKATKLGATGQGPVMDMFWGDRCGTIVDPDGYTWMVGTHKAEPTAKEMKEKMLEMMRQPPGGTATAA